MMKKPEPRHNKVLSVTQKLALDQITARKGSDPIFRHSLCPEVEVTDTYVFQHAGHLWKCTRSNWQVPGITGVVELYIPTAEDLVPIPIYGDRLVDLHVHGGVLTDGVLVEDYIMEIFTIPNNDDKPPVGIPDGYFSQCESEPEVLTPEDIADREQAIQEASEGKLDYLLEGTQWGPNLRKS